MSKPRTMVAMWMKKSRQVVAAWWAGWTSSMGAGSFVLGDAAEGSGIRTCSVGSAGEVSTVTETGGDAGDGSGF